MTVSVSSLSSSVKWWQNLLCFYRVALRIGCMLKAGKRPQTMQILLLISIRGLLVLPGKCFICQCSNHPDGILPVHFHSLKQSTSSRILIWASEEKARLIYSWLDNNNKKIPNLLPRVNFHHARDRWGDQTESEQIPLWHINPAWRERVLQARAVVPYGTHQWAGIMIHSVPTHLSVAKKLFHVCNQSNPPKVFGNRSNICSILCKGIVRAQTKEENKNHFKTW